MQKVSSLYISRLRWRSLDCFLLLATFSYRYTEPPALLYTLTYVYSLWLSVILLHDANSREISFVDTIVLLPRAAAAVLLKALCLMRLLLATAWIIICIFHCLWIIVCFEKLCLYCGGFSFVSFFVQLIFHGENNTLWCSVVKMVIFRVYSYKCQILLCDD